MAKKKTVSKAKKDAAEAAKQATEVAAMNIRKYLEVHREAEQYNVNVMQIHEEQFSRVLETAAEFAEKSLRRFIEEQKKK